MVPYREGIKHQAPAVSVVYGRARSGRIVHVSEVASGLACDCCCPSCGRALVAKKGTIREFHFAHACGSECPSASETALHQYAKQIIKDELAVVVPEWRVQSAQRSYTLTCAKRLEFEDGILECEIDSIVADILLQKEGKRLAVEIAVTHECDSIKISKIKSLGLAAFEIDLSSLARDSGPDLVRHAVLFAAPRKWISNPKLESQEASVRQRWHELDEADNQRTENARRREQAREDARINRVAQKIVSSCVADAGHPDTDAHVTAAARVYAAGLGRFIGVPTDGDDSIAVSRHHWQTMILDFFVLGASHRRAPEFSTKWVHQTFLKWRFIDRACAGFIGDGVRSVVRETLPNFRTPYEVIRSYLQQLCGAGVLLRHGNRWTPAFVIQVVPASVSESFRWASA